MTSAERKQYKAKQLRYKKPIARDMNLDYIREQVWEMQDVVSDVQWCDEDDLVDALGEDEAYEFRMAFADLAAELERFEDDLNDPLIPGCFDDLFPAIGADQFGGYFGYDSYEGDYYGLEPYEYGYAEKEAEKRICRMTKAELLEAVGACLRVYSAFVGLRYRYDCLEASLDILREKNLEVLRLFRAIEEQYDKAETESEHFKWQYCKEVVELNRMLEKVPQEYWL